MRASVRDTYGGPEVLRIVNLPDPLPMGKQVTVSMRAASVNEWDWAQLTGIPRAYRALHGLFRPKFSILGIDVAGEVIGVGDEVTEFKRGDRVCGDLSSFGFGCFAETVLAHESALRHIPSSVTFEQASTLPHAGGLAAQLLESGGIRSGQRVLVNGAGGGAGVLAVQLAKLHDVEVTAVDKASKLDMLRELGADHVIDYQSEDFAQGDIRYDLIADVHTTRAPSAYARVLHESGRYVTVGGRLSRLLQMVTIGALRSRLSKKSLRLIAMKANQDLDHLCGLVADGRLSPVIDRSYPLAELPEALRYYSTADHRGKVVVTPS